MLAQLRTDLAQAARTLLRHPGLTFTALFSLVVGIGITTGTFTLLNAMILRPIPGIAEQDRLLTLWLSVREAEGGHSPLWRLSYPDFQVVQRAANVFEGVAAAAEADVAVELAGVPQLVRAELVTPDYFAVLGTRPLRGRFPASGDEPGADAVVISYEYWQTQLGGDAAALGRVLKVNGTAFTIAAVAPPRFHGMTPADALARPESLIAIWLPISAVDRVRPFGVRDDPLRATGERWLRVLGRVRAGVDMDAARAAVPALAGALAEAYPRERQGAELVGGDLIFGPGAGAARTTLLFAAFLVVPLLVLLIACVNVANLLLASGVSRQRELAVRLSLGASRGRLLTLLLRESAVLALAAGLLSLAFALCTSRIAAAFSIRPAIEVPVDLRVLLFALATAALTAFGFGLLPALRATRLQPAAIIAGGAASESGSTLRLRRVLVAAQLALCFIMLVTCTLFVRSIGRGMEVDTGFAEDELLLVDVNLDVLGATEAEGDAIFRRIEEALSSVREVRAFGTALSLPLTGARDVRVGSTADPGAQRPARADIVGPGYFEAAGLELAAGTGFDASDANPTAARAVVNRALAELLWPGAPALGRTVRLGDDARELTVIGVVENARTSLPAVPEPLLYLPISAEYSPYRVFVIRASRPARAIAVLRAAFAAAEPRLPVITVTTMRDLRRAALLPMRLTARGLGAVGAIALLLAAVGLYGLISYNVTRRTREIGVRVALGASRRDISLWVLRGSMVTVLLGLAAGLPLAASLAFALRNGLFGIPALDPWSFGAVALLLLLVASIGAVVPARRAAAIQPGIAIRTE